MRLAPALLVLTLTLATVALAGFPGRASVGTAEAQAAIALTQVASGFAAPLLVTHAGDGSGRLFIVERGGRIRILHNGAVVPTPFLDISAEILAGGEQGLLGLAFHPRYEHNGRFFVFYTAANGDNTIAEFAVSGDANVANPASRRVLLAIPDSHPTHNGGMLAFGPDGYLYAGTGDEGGIGDPLGNAQNLNSLFGKMLRLDVDGALPYAIPPTNPFAGGGGRPEIWAFGLRNPWRWSFDRLTGDLWIADVGQATWEEINRQPAGSPGGANYGWNITEGPDCFWPPVNCTTAGMTVPVAAYSHNDGCSITGGYVYRGTALTALTGAYLYGDFCSGRIWSLTRDIRGRWTPSLLIDTALLISSFGEDEAGEVYVANLSGGTIFRLAAVAGAPTATPSATVSATATTCGRWGCATATATATATPSPTVTGTAPPAATATPTATACGLRFCPPLTASATPTPSATTCPRGLCGIP